MIYIRITSTTTITPLFTLVVIVCIKLWRVLSTLDLTRCQNSKQCDLNLTSGFRDWVVIVRIRR